MRLPGELNLNFTNEVNLTIEAENWSSTLLWLGTTKTVIVVVRKFNLQNCLTTAARTAEKQIQTN